MILEQLVSLPFTSDVETVRPEDWRRDLAFGTQPGGGTQPRGDVPHPTSTSNKEPMFGGSKLESTT